MFTPILNDTLRYRVPWSFNALYDCYITAKYGKSIMSLRKHDMESVLVCSLTNICNTILMWSHYASNHKGFVVEYDTHELKNIKEPQMEVFSLVEHSDEIPNRHLLTHNAKRDIVQAVCHKASCWKYENEIRSVIYDTPYPIGNDYKDLKVQKTSYPQ